MISAERCTRRSLLDVPYTVRRAGAAVERRRTVTEVHISFYGGMNSSVLSYLNHLGHGADIEYRDRRLMPVVFFVYGVKYRKTSVYRMKECFHARPQ